MFQISVTIVPMMVMMLVRNMVITVVILVLFTKQKAVQASC